MKESFPIVDPLSAGHSLADKKLKEEAIAKLEKQIDEYADLEEEAVRLDEEARKEELEEIYKKDDDEGIMDDIDPSRRRN